MEIIQIQKSYIPEVVSLWNHAIEAQGEGFYRNNLSQDRLLNIMENEAFFPAGALIAQSEGKLTGFVMGSRGPDTGYLAGLAVHPDRWRQGIGRMLLDALEDALRKAGMSSVSLDIYDMPFCLVGQSYPYNGVFLDSIPYRFLVESDYRPLEHQLVLRNDLTDFRLSEDLRQLHKRLTAEGITFRWYQPRDRDLLMQFMAQHFAGGWHKAVQGAIDQEPPGKMLIALTLDKVIGFVGPFHPAWEPGGEGGFSSPGVSPDFRKRGIGKVLLHLGLDYLKSTGAGYTEYCTHATNPARFMYLGSGARIIKVSCCCFYKNLN